MSAALLKNSQSNDLLNKIHVMWEKDSQIDPTKIESASLEIPKLHSKYLQLLDHCKTSLRQLERKSAIVVRDRFLWYEGKLDKNLIDDYGWKYDPYDGLHIKTKSHKDLFLNSDPIIGTIEDEISVIKNSIDTLDEIMGSIRFRSNLIKNIIENRKLETGMGF